MNACSRWLLALALLAVLAACRAQPTPTPPPPMPTPVPRTPVPLSARAITTANAQDVQLLRCSEEVGWIYAFSLDGSFLAAPCDGALCLHDARTLALVRRLERDAPDDDTVLCAAFSPDGTLVAAGTRGGKVWLWDIASRTLETTLQGGRLGLYTLAFSDDGATLIASDLFPTVYAWRVAGGAPLGSFRGPNAVSHN